MLFAGDSVTFRGRIVAAVRARYGETGYEYWNAGVESFNTVQELRWYRRYNAVLAPDEVVLTFHPNDFETTPVAFADGRGGLVVYAPNAPVRSLNPWLFRHSRLYRIYLGRRRGGNAAIDAVVEETRAAVIEWQRLLAASGVRLTVVVLPLLKPYADWTPGDRLGREQILLTLEEQGIRHIDLLPVCEQAIADGIDPREAPGDDWHPSAAVADRFGAFLHEQGLLAPP